ncbi:M1 family metallopeptidase [Maribacter chungangensis]|uniref:Aminopeptidase N n=1 Tax=Maribacter chungangensis TaxID=1069117 RepID=A0ABW3B2T2_9FLAO
MPRISIVVTIFFTFLSVAQHQDKVDFLSARAIIYPVPEDKMIRGAIDYQFLVIDRLDSIFLDAKNMDFTSVKLNSKNQQFRYDGKYIVVHKKFKKGNTYSLQLIYTCRPKQTVYFSGWDDSVDGNEQIWTQGQGKYTSHWLPSFDDMEEKVEFDLTIYGGSNMTIVANGKLMEKTFGGQGTYDWQFDMQKPMSSYLLAFAIGDYKKQVLTSKSGIPIENYFYPSDSVRVEPTYRYTKEIFDFLETEIGVPYPWQNYKQVPVHDFLYAGMENTGATIFSDGFMIDSTAFTDKNYVNVNAHELAHQWFGNLVTEKNGEHHWLHEGFATYYAYLAEKELFGDDHFYWKLYETAQQLISISEKGEGQSLLDSKASSLTFYEKGAWALVALREEVGNDAFISGIQSYLRAYQFKNATVSQFLTEMAKGSKLDLSAYKKRWLESKQFPAAEAMAILEKYSPSLSLMSQMNKEFERMQSDAINYERYWNSSTSMHFKKYLIQQHHQLLPKSIIENAFAMVSLPIRQALANSLLGISATSQDKEIWKTSYETLLEDKSYVTQEIALIKLWSIFEKERYLYLDKLSDTVGLPNKNIRLLWLTLALVTPDYRMGEKADYLNELIHYTKSVYNPEIRQMAFTYLRDIQIMNTAVLKQLIKATNHHSWQFRNFARRLLDEQLENEVAKSQIETVRKELKEDDLRYLNTKLNLE